MDKRNPIGGDWRRRFAIITMLYVVAAAPSPHAAPDAARVRAAAVPLPADSHRYIVQLADPPLAEYHGGIGKLAATSASATGRVHLDYRSAAARAYRSYLAGLQQQVIDRLRAVSPSVRLDWQYAYTLNGFAARMPAEAAGRLRAVAGVAAVEPAEYFAPDLDTSAPVVGAPAAWAEAGGLDRAGQGARVAIVDTGMDAGHPMFTDDGMGPAPGGFPVAKLHLRGGRELAYPDAGQFVNGKLIAARSFPSPEMVEGLTDAEVLARFTPFDGGHGLHVGGIAAGRSVAVLLPLIWQVTQAVTLSGIAPMAWVMNYRYDFSTGAEYGRGVNLSASPELVAMLEQMVEDEVDVLNLSEGHVTFLTDHYGTHPLARAFEAAADAGIVVVASAGNSGANGAPSLSGAFKHSDKVLAIANTTSNGSVDIPLVITGSDSSLTLWAGPRGAAPITENVSARLYLAPNGGCAVDPAAAGKMAVVLREEGPCAYDVRATMMYSSGAQAIVYVYSDRDHGGASEQVLALPGVALGRRDGPAFLARLRASPDGLQGTIYPDVSRGHNGVADVLAASSGRGPGIDGTLKPDLSAPGTAIWSSVNDGTLLDPVREYAALSGTSMSAPHVAGAVAVVRGGHPTWTTAQVHSALINTSAPSVTVAVGTQFRPASPTEGGVGRLDLTRALAPGAFLAPTKVSFGRLVEGVAAGEVILTLTGQGERQTWQVETEALSGTGRVQVGPGAVTVGPGETARLTVTLAASELKAGEHWGELRLVGSAGGRLRTMYYAIVEDPAVRKDALLVNFTMGATPDHASAYTETLAGLNLTYDVHRIDETANPRHPTLETLRHYDLVVINTNESPRALQSVGGFYAYQNYLIQGGNLLVAGLGLQDWYTFPNAAGAPVWPSQNDGCDMCLARYFAGFQFELTSTLKGRVETWPSMKVLLEPPPAVTGSMSSPTFNYPLDLSTGSYAADGAAGNQAAFASGGLLGPYDPAYDHPYTEGVFDRVRPWARPLWQYDGRVVGSFVAGRLNPDARIRWNAMFWGFGLEGLGRPPTSTIRARALGDAFNLLAHNVVPRLNVISASVADTRLAVAVDPTADPIAVAQALIDWGDGMPQILLVGGAELRTLRFSHTYRGAGRYPVKIELYPVAHAAPLRVSGLVQVDFLASRAILPYTER